MKHEKIPQHLKATAEWCCWKYEQKPGKAKPDKIPKTPRTSGNASVSIPNTFSDFDTVIKALVKFDGIGTRASKNLALIGLDHCVENGSVVPWAQEIIDHFPDAYVEISPSETDIHIICKVSDDFVFDKETFYNKERQLRTIHCRIHQPFPQCYRGLQFVIFFLYYVLIL